MVEVLNSDTKLGTINRNTVVFSGWVHSCFYKKRNKDCYVNKLRNKRKSMQDELMPWNIIDSLSAMSTLI